MRELCLSVCRRGNPKFCCNVLGDAAGQYQWKLGLMSYGHGCVWKFCSYLILAGLFFFKGGGHWVEDFLKVYWACTIFIYIYLDIDMCVCVCAVSYTHLTLPTTAEV